jgi:cytochrome c-type biogenesis protein CcmH/NrfG
LQQLLRQSPRDVESHLMLATLYRHTSRREEALERLRLLERLDGSERWRWEIARERELLERTAEPAAVGGEGKQTASAQGQDEATTPASNQGGSTHV